MGKVIVWLPLAAVLGGIVGAWGPYEELRALKERGEERKDEARPAKRTGFSPIAQIINVPDAAKHPRRAKAPKPPKNSEPKEVAPENDKAPEKAEKSPVRPMLSPEDMQARIDEAADLWRTRIQLVRATALENLGIASDGADRFDSTIADMNDKLRESMQALADALANEEEMTPEMGVRLMGDLSVTLAETYDHLGECVDSSRRMDVSSLNLVEFIDPSVAEPLIAVQGKLDGRMGRRGGGK
jgi:hypothetical protein